MRVLVRKCAFVQNVGRWLVLESDSFLYPKGIMVQDSVAHLPIYMAMFL
ncbi:MAG: hypothetical protein IJ521_10725 [Schwartzia sp.]|nr:hypothetical protein [Schwartzia sp. (in: firmicutes)]